MALKGRRISAHAIVFRALNLAIVMATLFRAVAGGGVLTQSQQVPPPPIPPPPPRSNVALSCAFAKCSAALSSWPSLPQRELLGSITRTPLADLHAYGRFLCKTGSTHHQPCHARVT